MFSREDVVKLLLQKKGVDPFSTGGVSVVKERSKVSFSEGRKYLESPIMFESKYSRIHRNKSLSNAPKILIYSINSIASVT